MLIKVYRFLSIDSLMIPAVVLLDERCHSDVQLQATAGRVKVDVLALQRAEETLDEGIIGGSAFAVH